MGKKKLIVSLAMVALSGCGIPSFWKKDTKQENPPEPAVNVSNPVVSTKPNPRSSQAGPNFVPELIATTNAKERRKTIVKGRNDPFTIIPIEPIITIEGTAPPPPPTITQPPTPQVTRDPTPQVTQPPLPEVVPKPVSKPLPPQPVLARGVAVTGLIQVGAVTKIIVKSPLEKYSRYVEQGQYLANGQVLVKRIETGGAKPIVVLEELGMEVIKRVGDKGIKPEVEKPEEV